MTLVPPMPKRRNIVVISHMYPRCNRGNYGTFVHEQVRALRDAAPDATISVISPVQYAPAVLARRSAKWRQYRETEESRVDFEDVKVWFPRFLSAPRKMLRSIAVWSCYRAITKSPEMVDAIERSDVVIAHTALFDGRLARRIARRFGKDYWVYIHGEDVFQNTFGYRNVARRRSISATLGSAEGIVTVSAFMKAAIDRAYGTSGKSYVNHNGVDPARFNGSPRVAGMGLRIISASFLIPRKAHRYVLEALADLKHEGLDFEYRIAGDGAERQGLEALSARLGLDDRVTFSGRYQLEGFPEMLEAHDLFVLPSWDEAFGVVYVEAMAMGLPVIAAYDAGAPDIVTEGVDGFLVPPRDRAAVADAIRSYAQLSDADKAEMSTNAIEKAHQFTWDDNAQNLLRIIERAGGDIG